VSAGGLSSVAWAGTPPNFTAQGQGQRTTATSSAGIRYLTWKVPTSVEAGPAQTLRVIAPASARLFYAPASVWGGNLNDQETADRARTSYTFSGCDGRVTQFPGMILVTAPACVVLRVEGDGAKTVEVPMYGKTCP